MRVHSKAKIQELKKLRSLGYSINEIVKELGIPKTTVWHHIQHATINPKFLAQLKSKRGGSLVRNQQAWQQARIDAHQLLMSEHRELLVMVAMLYWGEGSKRSPEFINSDGRIIWLYLLVLRKVFHIDDSSIKPTLRIFTGMDGETCLNYWSDITGIPKESFFVYYNDGGTKGRTPYGMCRITVRKGHRFLKTMHSIIVELYDEVLQKPQVKLY